MSTRTITGNIAVHLSGAYGPQDLLGDDKTVFSRLTFADHDMSQYGYAAVGTATVTVTLNDEATIIGDKVVALRAEANKVLADATAAVTSINRRINELLAITNEVSK